MNDTLSENSTVGTQPSHEQITRRAQELWEQYGRPSGRDEEIWYEAERALKSASSDTQSTATAEPMASVPPTTVTPTPKSSATATPKTAQSSRATAAAKIPTLRASKNGGR